MKNELTIWFEEQFGKCPDAERIKLSCLKLQLEAKKKELAILQERVDKAELYLIKKDVAEKTEWAHAFIHLKVRPHVES